MIPTCPAPVKMGGKCSVNEDCKNHEMDLDEPSYPPEGGYCKNGKVLGIGTSIGCSGTCIPKLDNGAICAKPALNISPLDPTKMGESEDAQNLEEPFEMAQGVQRMMTAKAGIAKG